MSTAKDLSSRPVFPDGPPSDPTRVLVAGDVHGDPYWIKQLIQYAKELECAGILQLGDFGARWPGNNSQFERTASERLVAEDLWCWFIDGNHEGWPGLLKAQAESDSQAVEIEPRVIWLTRGLRWAWNGIRFGALGGAFSVDCRFRADGFNWWRVEECPTEDDLDILGDERLDVLLTHDAPSSVTLPEGMNLSYDLELRANEIRDRLELARQMTAPSLVLHGHWHYRQHSVAARRSASDPDRWISSVVESLASNMEREGSFGVLDIGDQLRFTPDDQLPISQHN